MAGNVAEYTVRVIEILGHPGKMFVGGDWVDGSSGETLEIVDPATSGALATYPLASGRDVDEAVAVAGTLVIAQSTRGRVRIGVNHAAEGGWMA